jgi:uncharacterized protein
MTGRDAGYWIEKLGLAAHPEGGWFAETYRSAESIDGEALPTRYDGARSFSTAIYFLLEGSQRSVFHRLASDELWHHYDGTAVVLCLIDPGGALRTIRLGPDPERGESFQAVIPAGTWFGGWVPDPDGFALVGCTVAPGFSFADFEMADRAAFLESFPQHRNIIERLTNLP